MLLTTLTPVRHNQVVAQTVLSCSLTAGNRNQINHAIADYNQLNQGVLSNRITTSSTGDSRIQITNLGIADAAGEIVNPLGIVAEGLLAEYQQQGLSFEEANRATLNTLTAWTELTADAASTTVIATIKQSLIEELGTEKTEVINQIPDSSLLTALAGLNNTSLSTLGLDSAEIVATAQIEITPQAEGSLIAQIQNMIANVAELSSPEANANITSFQDNLVLELDNIRQGNQTLINAGSVVSFRFRLDNQSDRPRGIKLPNIQTITETGLVGTGEVTRVSYRVPGTEANTLTDTAQEVVIPGQQALDLSIQVRVGQAATDSITSVGIDLQTNCGDRNLVQQLNLVPPLILTTEEEPELIDPRGQVSGCSGELLADYLGFSVALYDVDGSDPTQSEPAGLVPLTTTELPNEPDNNIPEGIEPNTQNSNPFFLTNEDEGKYSFLFDDAKGQLDFGRDYILVVDPGENSTYDQRQVRLTIGDRQDRIVEYTATSLDGRPISAEDGATTITGRIVLVEDAERIGLNLAVLDLTTDICDAQEISLTKTGDRASAEPGDIVLYRLTVQNLSSTPLTNFQITDTLPPGFALHDETVLGEVNSTLVEIEINSSSDRVVNFAANTTLEQGQSLSLVYATEISPDALRGDADNSAIVNAQRTDNSQTVKDGPAVYSLQLESGIIRDAGTIIGRVFVDHNFDGEQQSEEPGIPNAVIYLENGNRIITDADGLFSVSNVLPGYHTGVLDLTSIPEYNLAPNIRFIERNSSSRLVNLEPGGLVRMNFGVTPTAKEQQDNSEVKAPSATSETPGLDQ
ncbi:MAG: DUF11 domain-containing protein [Cyanobacteria bacterium P01_G01_bin.39]